MKTTEETIKVIMTGLCSREDDESEYCPLIEHLAAEAVEDFEFCVQEEMIDPEAAVHFMCLVDSMYRREAYFEGTKVLGEIFRYAGREDVTERLELLSGFDELYDNAYEDFLLLFLDTDEIDECLMEMHLRIIAKKQEMERSREGRKAEFFS